MGVETKYEGRVYRDAGNAWAWTTSMNAASTLCEGVDASRDEAFKALVEEFEWLGEKNPAIEPGP